MKTKEKLAARMVIRKDFRAIIKGIAAGLKLMEFPAGAMTTEEINADRLTASVHCGFGFARSGEIAQLVSHHAAFVAFAEKHKCEIKLASTYVGKPDASDGGDMATRQFLRLRFPKGV